MAKKSVMRRVGRTFDGEITRLSRESGMPKVYLTDKLGSKLKGMMYHSDINIFKEPDLYETFRGYKKSKNKRGNVMDVLFIVVAFFILAVSAITSVYIFDAYNDEIQNDTDIAADAKTAIGDFEARFPKAIDPGIILALVAAHISVIVLGLSLRSLPVLFPILMIILLVVSVLAGYLANSWNDDVASDAELNAFSTELPMTSWILDNYVIVTLFWGFFDILVFVALSSLRGASI